MRLSERALFFMATKRYNPKRLPRVGTTGVSYGKLSVRNAMSYEAYK